MVQKLAETRLFERPQSKQTKYCFLWLLLMSLVMHVSSYSFFIDFIIFMIQIYHLNHENQKCPVLRAVRRWGTSPYIITNGFNKVYSGERPFGRMEFGRML